MNIEKSPIFVDLDGTLLRTDLFFESIVRFVKRNPLNVFRVLRWTAKSRAFAKEELARREPLDVESLPYETDLISYLQEQKENGRRLVLATASHRDYAESVATHLGLFDEVLATENGENLKGRAKLAAICRASSDEEFVYAGDSVADRPIWDAASASILVNAPVKDVEKARRAQKAEKVFSSRTPVWRAFIEEMRPLQYFKNILVFVPLLTSHEYTISAMLFASVLAFICFCLCASGVYFINDLLDLSADRVHPTKKSRPLASGDLPIHLGLAGGLGLPVFSFALAAAFLPSVFVLVLGLYFVFTNAYSFYAKSRSTADVLTLAVLYTSRIFAGAAALGIWPSFWLIAFSIFVFVSLAYLKRYVEVASTPHVSENVPGRGYSFDDAETMFSLGVANITASVLILALYINSEEVVGLYQNPKILWLLCLLMLFWGNRIWVGARRGKIDDDPIVFAVKDRMSQMVGAGFVLVVLAARYLG